MLSLDGSQFSQNISIQDNFKNKATLLVFVLKFYESSSYHQIQIDVKIIIIYNIQNIIFNLMKMILTRGLRKKKKMSLDGADN